MYNVHDVLIGEVVCRQGVLYSDPCVMLSTSGRGTCRNIIESLCMRFVLKISGVVTVPMECPEAGLGAHEQIYGGLRPEV